MTPETMSETETTMTDEYHDPNRIGTYGYVFRGKQETTMTEPETRAIYNREALAIVRRELEAVASMTDEERRAVATPQNQAVWIVWSLAEAGFITARPEPSDWNYVDPNRIGSAYVFRGSQADQTRPEPSAPGDVVTISHETAEQARQAFMLAQAVLDALGGSQPDRRAHDGFRVHIDRAEAELDAALRAADPAPEDAT